MTLQDIPHDELLAEVQRRPSEDDRYALALQDTAAIERFHQSYTSGEPDECWPWAKNISSHGYGRLPFRGRKLIASRLALAIKMGRSVPSRLDACHSCDNRACVNPSHLWAGTRQENILDCSHKGRLANPTKADPSISWRSKRTACERGHPFTAENVRISRGKHRVCRTCERINAANKRARHRIKLRGADIKLREGKFLYAY